MRIRTYGAVVSKKLAFLSKLWQVVAPCSDAFQNHKMVRSESAILNCKYFPALCKHSHRLVHISWLADTLVYNFVWPERTVRALDIIMGSDSIIESDTSTTSNVPAQLAHKAPTYSPPYFIQISALTRNKLPAKLAYWKGISTRAIASAYHP